MDRISRKQCRHKPADGTPQPGEHTECNQATRPEGLEHPVEHILHPFQHNDYIRDSVIFHFQILLVFYYFYSINRGILYSIRNWRG